VTWWSEDTLPVDESVVWDLEPELSDEDVQAILAWLDESS
jgi:hypothetical protein